MFGVFRVKNHDFTPKNHIFSNFRGAPSPLDPPQNDKMYFQNKNYEKLCLFFYFRNRRVQEREIINTLFTDVRVAE
jgi:hypothetical protein